MSALRERLVNPTTAGPAGVWMLGDGDPEPLAAWDIGPAVLLVPTEQLLLLAVDLPLASPRRRLESLPFAVEDRIAAGVDAVHMAIGAELAPKRYLVGVVDHPVMRGWVDRAEAAGLGHCAIMPDALALPLPPEGHWQVDISAGRALVRVADGTGFALPADQLVTAWQAGGQPALLASGDALPAGLVATPAVAPDPLADRLRVPLLDLRQGLYARRRVASPSIWRRIAIVAAAGLAAHTAIAAADTLLLANIAEDREQEARALLAMSAPGVPVGDDLVAAATPLLPVAGARPGTFLPLVSRVSAALAPLGAAFTLESIGFAGAAGTLALDVHAPDTATFARAADALRAAGLAVTAAPPSSASDGAHGRILVQGSRL